MSVKSIVSPLQRSIWQVELTSINGQSSSSSVPSPVKRLSVNPSSLLIEEHRISQPNVNPSKQGFSTLAKTLAFTIALGAICAAAILLPIVVTNILKGKTKVITTTTTTTTSSTSTSTTTSTSTSTSTSASTSTTTTTTQTTTTATTTTTTPNCGSGCANTATLTTSRIAFYSFDSNTNDATGAYSAGGIASPTYITGYVGSAIYFDSSLNERLSAPAMSLNSRSFTIEFWFWLSNSASTNYAFFGQMSVQNIGQQSLFLVAAAGKPYIGFFNDDLPGAPSLVDNTWYHGAFVYDISLTQQLIYIDGLLNAQSGVGAGAYLGTSGPITIGGADIYGSLGVPYLTGAMDHLSVSTRAKTACEILNDATLATYFPFDGSFTDAGPNVLTITSSGASFISGFVNQAAYLSGANSYIQISGLTGLGRVNYPFSIAFWLYPIVSGVLVHVHSGLAGTGWCTPFIGISATGNIIVQVHRSSAPYIIQGPIISLNTWTHIVHTFSPINGLSLYVNGVLYTTMPSATIYTASGGQNFVTIGNVLGGTGCYNPGILMTPYEGMIDEFRIYSRELSSIDVCLLAWP